MNTAFKSLVVALACGLGAINVFARTEFTWNGGASGDFAEPSNWLVGSSTATRVPSTTDDFLIFLDDTTAEIDLKEGSVQVGHIRLQSHSDITFKNGTFAFCLPKFTETTWYTVGSYATLRFSDVDASCSCGEHFAIVYGTNAKLEIVNGSTFTTPSAKAWLQNAAGGGVTVVDSTMNIANEVYFGYSDGFYGGRTTGPNGEKIVETWACTNATLNVGYLRFWYSGNLDLHNSTMTVANDVRFERLQASHGYPSPEISFSGNLTSTMLSAARIYYANGFEAAGADTWRFAVVRGATADPVIQVGASGWGFVTGTYEGTKIVVDAPEGWSTTLGSSAVVPLVRSTKALTLPTCIATKDGSKVTLGDEVVDYQWSGADGKGNQGALDVTYGLPADPKPYVILSKDPKIASATTANLTLSVTALGEGATSYDLTAKVYADAQHEALLSTIPVAEAATAKADYSVTLPDLTMGTMYYIVAEIANDVPAKNELAFTYTFDYADAPADGAYTWLGIGDGKSWADPHNWGVKTSYPNAATATATFPEGSTVRTTLSDATLTLGTLYLGYQSDVIISNGTLTVNELLQSVNASSQSGDTKLTFAHVALARPDNNTYFAYGSTTPATAEVPISANCDLTFDHSTFTIAGEKGEVFISSSGGRFVASNSVVSAKGFYIGQWGNDLDAFILVDTQLVGSNGYSSRFRNSAGENVEVRYENAILTGFSNITDDNEGSKMRLYGNGQQWIGSSHLTAKTINVPLYFHDYYQGGKGMTFHATKDGFPGVTDVGSCGVRFDLNKRILKLVVDEDAGRPPHGRWTIAETANGAITYWGTMPVSTNVLTEYSAYIDYSGIANPEKYTIEAGTKSLKLAWPKRGVKFTLR